MTIFLPTARTSTKSVTFGQAHSRTDAAGNGHLAFVLNFYKGTHKIKFLMPEIR